MSSIYRKIAVGNLRKNARFYVPHIIAGAGLQACFYIVLTLTLDNRLQSVRGGAYIMAFMAIGTIITTGLAAILILYTNSFLMKQRMREFGIYNVLGLEKGHIGRVLFYESIISNLVSVILGLFSGILFYKLCTLIFCRILQVDSIPGFYYLSMITIIPSALLFVGLYLAAYLINRISIRVMKPVDLLQSSHAGEKEPKVKWLLFLLGLATMGGGYYISITTSGPLQAVNNFFPAVILVIIGTYCLFVAGSIAVLRFLKRRKHYYYKKNHMVAVSGMLYRMKQNAVGLASIAILATMVIVMISSTFSLYVGVDENLSANYVQHFYFSANYEVIDENCEDGVRRVKIPLDELEVLMENVAEQEGVEIEKIQQRRYLEIGYGLKDGEFLVDTSRSGEVKDVIEVTYITQEEYSKIIGTNASIFEPVSLKSGEIAVCSMAPQNAGLPEEITIGGNKLRVVQNLPYFPIDAGMLDLVDCYGIVVPDQETMEMIYQNQKEGYGDKAADYCDEIAVTFTDIQKVSELGAEIDEKLHEELEQYIAGKENTTGVTGVSSDSYWDAKEYMIGMYGSLLFLGIILGTIFLFTTALIIYYKQISEGYEDRSRFQILQKIGMSAKEVQGTIRGQILMVFFLPLLIAGIHMAGAFPMIEKLLHILLLASTKTFVCCSLVTFAIFAAIYVLIYFLTARVYYKIIK